MSAKYVNTSRNTHRGLSKITLDLFNHMVLYNESIWKLLTFENVEIIDHEDDENYNCNIHSEMDIVGDNLTRQQKVALLFKDGDDANDYRVQLQKMTDDAEKVTQCRLHMYIDEIIPVDDYISIVNVNFNIICHNKFNMINGGKSSRIECVTEELINLFNGLILDSATGEVFFNYKKSRNTNRMVSDLSNSKNFFGNTLTMSVLFSKNEDKSLMNY